MNDYQTTKPKPEPATLIRRAERFFRIRILFSDGALQPDRMEVRLEPGQALTIGRQPAPNRFVLADPSVSRLHARLRDTVKGWEILDASGGATFVDGKPARSWTLLPQGGIITMGGTIAEFSQDGSVLGGEAFGGLSGGTAFASRLWFQQCRLVAASDDPVIFLGPVGAGKSACAEAVHKASRRGGHHFSKVNCAELNPNLVETELFGHVAGSYTGATGARDGLFRGAGEGTLFLDEVGELPLHLQTKLLVALETKHVRPVGSDRSEPYRARIMAATNRDLALEVDEKRFRADLYSRFMAQLRIDIPPLAERRADIPQFVAKTIGVDHWLFDFWLLNALLLHTWPGNFRDVSGFLKRLKDRRSDDDAFILEPILKFIEEYVPSDDALTEEQLLELLRIHDGNITAVAKAAGCSRKTIQNKMKQFRLRLKKAAR